MSLVPLSATVFPAPTANSWQSTLFCSSQPLAVVISRLRADEGAHLFHPTSWIFSSNFSRNQAIFVQAKLNYRHASIAYHSQFCAVSHLQCIFITSILYSVCWDARNVGRLKRINLSVRGDEDPLFILFRASNCFMCQYLWRYSCNVTIWGGIHTYIHNYPRTPSKITIFCSCLPNWIIWTQGEDGTLGNVPPSSTP